MESRCWERKGKTRKSRKDGANFSVNIETPLEDSWRTFLLRGRQVTTCGAGTDGPSLLSAALHPCLDPTLVFPTLGQRWSLSPAVSGGKQRGKDHVGHALSHTREGPWDGQPDAGTFVLPERLKWLRKNLLSLRWESPPPKSCNLLQTGYGRIFYVAAVLSLIRYKICIEEVPLNKKRKGKSWAKKRKNRGE